MISINYIQALELRRLIFLHKERIINDYGQSVYDQINLFNVNKLCVLIGFVATMDGESATISLSLEDINLLISVNIGI